MINKLIFLFLLFSIIEASANIKEKIIQNLETTNNLTFNFEQNVNGKTENGHCALSYPQKIFCKYNLKNNKILVSNGKSLVIKTETSFYRYSLKKTPLNLILDKNFLIKKINILKENVINGNLINFAIIENDNEINVFFDNKTFNLVGWKTKDIYQNTNITYLSSIETNKEITKNLFKIPNQH
jgi:outer membrane lipoprotein-sorting protein